MSGNRKLKNNCENSGLNSILNISLEKYFSFNTELLLKHIQNK